MTIYDMLGKKWECNCLGCSIGNGEIIPPGGLIMETENFVLHQDPEVPLKGFLIVASKKHIRSISELTEEESKELFNLVYKGRMAQKTIEDIREVTIIQEERSGHFHLWLLPRYEWMDGKFNNSLSAVREFSAYAKANLKTEENIKDILSAVDQIRKNIR